MLCYSHQLIQLRSNQPFWDPSTIQSNFATSLPDPLRIRPNGLQQHQLNVYEDFGRICQCSKPLVANSSPGLDHKPRATSRSSSTAPFTTYAPSPGPEPQVQQYPNHQEAM